MFSFCQSYGALSVPQFVKAIVDCNDKIEVALVVGLGACFVFIRIL
jgi:hypothetical protein